ncbi:hypothetical protein BC629DRAFT_1438926 [Irpex lacteus]|nr:hypothetical protein BC629DRAFT_1438926 [Irpex lacteus]
MYYSYAWSCQHFDMWSSSCGSSGRPPVQSEDRMNFQEQSLKLAYILKSARSPEDTSNHHHQDTVPSSLWGSIRLLLRVPSSSQNSCKEGDFWWPVSDDMHAYYDRRAKQNQPSGPQTGPVDASLSASSHCRLLEALEAFHAGKKQNGRPSFTRLSPDSRSRTLGASPTSVASRAPKLTYDDGAVPLRMCTLNRGSRLLRSRTSYWFPSSWPLHCFAGSGCMLLAAMRIDEKSKGWANGSTWIGVVGRATIVPSSFRDRSRICSLRRRSHVPASAKLLTSTAGPGTGVESTNKLLPAALITDISSFISGVGRAVPILDVDEKDDVPSDARGVLAQEHESSSYPLWDTFVLALPRREESLAPPESIQLRFPASARGTGPPFPRSQWWVRRTEDLVLSVTGHCLSFRPSTVFNRILPCIRVTTRVHRQTLSYSAEPPPLNGPFQVHSACLFSQQQLLPPPVKFQDHALTSDQSVVPGSFMCLLEGATWSRRSSGPEPEVEQSGSQKPAGGLAVSASTALEDQLKETFTVCTPTVLKTFVPGMLKDVNSVYLPDKAMRRVGLLAKSQPEADSRDAQAAVQTLSFGTPDDMPLESTNHI